MEGVFLLQFWNRLSSKKKTRESWNLQLTPRKFLVSVCLDLPLVAEGAAARAPLAESSRESQAACLAQPLWSKANSTAGHRARVMTDIVEIPATQTTVSVSQMGSFVWQMPFSLLFPQQNWACSLCSCILADVFWLFSVNLSHILNTQVWKLEFTWHWKTSHWNFFSHINSRKCSSKQLHK